MSCTSKGPIECQTIQIIEPDDDLLVDTAGTHSDIDERGVLELDEGQLNADIAFQMPKLNAAYNFEYLYVDALGHSHPGTVLVIPTAQTIAGFSVVFAGSPIAAGYILHWRVVVVTTSSLVRIDFPEVQYLQMPQAAVMSVTFLNPRSNTDYGFTELRVENRTDLPDIQAVIHVQVYEKNTNGFLIAVNPIPPTANYFLAMRTP